MTPKLIKTIAEVQQNVPVNMTSDFDVVSDFLAAAESMFLVKLIGTDQVTALKTAYDESTSDEVLITAIQYCQSVISKLGYFLAIPVLNVSVGSSGIQIFSNSDTKSAFQWQVEDLKNSLIDLGFTALESLLELLESDDDKFAPYFESPQYIKSQELIINKADDFSGYFNIGDSRYVFYTIAYIMRRVEERTVKKLFGDIFYQTLKAGDLSDQKTKLVNDYVKPGIALITAAKAIQERVISFKNGTVAVNYKGRTDNMNESVAATTDQITAMHDQLVADGSAFLQDGIQFINANLTDFSDYVAPPAFRSRFKFNNNPLKGVFGV